MKNRIKITIDIWRNLLTIDFWETISVDTYSCHALVKAIRLIAWRNRDRMGKGEWAENGRSSRGRGGEHEGDHLN